MPYLAAAVANSFLDVAKSAGEPVDPMKLQKLVYFGHGWHLGYGRGALSAEYAEAWRWGPVFLELYHAVKIWGGRPIMEPVRAVEINHGSIRRSTPRIPSGEDFANKLVKRVWEVYGHMSGPALSQLTHERGGPWQVIRDRSPGEVIPNSLIRDYFAQQLQQLKKNAGI